MPRRHTQLRQLFCMCPIVGKSHASTYENGSLAPIYGQFCALARAIDKNVAVLIFEKMNSDRGSLLRPEVKFTGLTEYQPVQSAAAFLASGEISSRPFGRPGGMPCFPSLAELIERALM